MQEEWLDQQIDQWQGQATQYPTKALLTMMRWLYYEQQERLTQQHGYLDATAWNKEEWQQPGELE